MRFDHVEATTRSARFKRAALVLTRRGDGARRAGAASCPPRPPSRRRARPISPTSSTASPRRWSTFRRPRRSRTRAPRRCPTCRRARRSTTCSSSSSRTTASTTARRAPHKTSSLGSGFVIDPSGIVITNNHVIGDANDIVVIFTDGRKLKAKIIGKDPKVDVAVLKVESDKPLKTVKFGDSDKMRVGDGVMAVGNPFGLGETVTAGIISARNRNIDSGPYDDFLQTDASINKGNSGGPLFNLQGEVIGINTAILSPSGGSIGIGFATPSASVHAGDRAAREVHETRRGWLGVRIQPVDDAIADSLGLGSGARRAGRRRRRAGPGQARRPDGGRRDRQVRRQGHQGIARSAAPGRRDAGRQGRSRSSSCARARRSPRR